MMRHAVNQAAISAGWSDERRATVVHGHAADGSVAKGGADLPRFAYLPLPSIERRDRGEHIGRTLRVMVAAPQALAAEIAWLRRSLSGAELIDEASNTPEALLSLLPDDEWMLRRYTGPAAEWATVTPVVLPGYDEGEPARTEALLRRSLLHAGIPQSLADQAEVAWRRVGWFPGLDLSTRYDTAGFLKGRPRYHLRVRWQCGGQPCPVPGPVAVGAGRYAGFGLLAPEGPAR
jgi:CRISPR-associated protein Csb2